MKKRERKATARLCEALDEAGASESMKIRAYLGCYHDFDTDSPTPITDLVRDARAEGLDDLAKRAAAGEFDGW